MKNGIDLTGFNFNKEDTKQVRKDVSLRKNYSWECCQINGTKKFLLEVLFKLKKTKKNVVLMLIGDGPDKEKLIEKAKQLRGEEDIIWLGTQREIVKFLCTMDCFVFPSIHEGLGISLVEAQAYPDI